MTLWRPEVEASLLLLLLLSLSNDHSPRLRPISASDHCLERKNEETNRKYLFVELVFCLVLLDVVLVTLLEVLGQYDVSILSDSLQQN